MKSQRQGQELGALSDVADPVLQLLGMGALDGRLPQQGESAAEACCVGGEVGWRHKCRGRLSCREHADPFATVYEAEDDAACPANGVAEAGPPGAVGHPAFGVSVLRAGTSLGTVHFYPATGRPAANHSGAACRTPRAPDLRGRGVR